ncbi:hypothetical protein EDC48_101401, partial [Gibbsiella quercinecans]
MLNKYRPTRRCYQLIDQISFTFPVMARRSEYAVLHINNDHSFILYAFPSPLCQDRWHPLSKTLMTRWDPIVKRISPERKSAALAKLLPP